MGSLANLACRVTGCQEQDMPELQAEAKVTERRKDSCCRAQLPQQAPPLLQLHHLGVCLLHDRHRRLHACVHGRPVPYHHAEGCAQVGGGLGQEGVAAPAGRERPQVGSAEYKETTGSQMHSMLRWLCGVYPRLHQAARKRFSPDTSHRVLVMSG